MKINKSFFNHFNEISGSYSRYIWKPLENQRSDLKLICWLLLTAVITFSVNSVFAATAEDFRTMEYMRNGAALDSIHAAEAYALGYTGAGVTVGIIDRNADLTGDEFQGRIDSGAHWISDPNDGNDHGFWVAGVIGAAKNNIGIHGVAYNVNLLPLGTDASTLALAQAMQTMAAHPDVKIINNSWGFSLYYDEIASYGSDTQAELTDTIIPIFQSLGETLANQGQLMVFSAGNDGHLTPSLLSAFPTLLDTTGFQDNIANNWLNVMAYDPTQASTSAAFIATFSNLAQGASDYSLLAPGVGINTTSENNSYVTTNGTSFAAPYVSGVAALVSEAFPYMSGKQLADVLLSTATRLTGANLPKAVVLLRQDFDDSQQLTGVTIKVYSTRTGITFSDEEMTALIKSVKIQIPSVADDRVKAVILAAATDQSITVLSQNDYGALFGQGIVNAYKAVQGPGALNAKRLTDSDLNDGQFGGKYALYSVNTQGFDSTWSNDIAQVKNDVSSSTLFQLDVGLRKQGTGTLYLTGNDTFAGPTVIEGGKLVVGKVAGGSGSLAGSVWVASGAVLGGHGTVKGSVVVQSNGTLSPGNSIGTLTVGNVLFNPGSVYEYEIDSQGNTDKLIVTNNAALAGTLKVVNQNVGHLGDHFTLLEVGGTLSGSFDNLEAANSALFLTDKLGYGAQNAFIDVTRNNVLFSDVALGSNQKAVANAIESQSGGPVFSAIADLQDVGSAQRAFDNLSGEFFATSRSALIQNSRYVRDALNSTMRTAGMAEHPWLNTWTYDGHQDSEGPRAGVKHDGYGLLIGNGGRIGKQGAMGFAIGAEKGQITMDDRASRADVTAYHIAGYLSGHTLALDLHSGISYSYLTLDSQRDITVAGLNGVAEADYHANLAQGFVEASHRFSFFDIVSFEPYGNAAYVWLQSPRGQETGNRAALVFDKETSEAAFTTAGLRMEIQLLSSVPISLYGDVGYQHRMTEEANQMQLQFVQGGDQYEVEGLQPAENLTLLRVGVKADFSRDMHLLLEYQGDHAANVKDDSARVQFSMAF